jgi:Mce-associated membrane protein
VTVVVSETTTAILKSSENTLAPWHIRLGAFAVDVLPALAVATTAALVAFTVRHHPVWWWVCVAVFGLAILLTLVNRLLLPSVLGFSLGRALFGIAVVRRDGGSVGPWSLLGRDVAHLLDTLSVVGWLWPLWDSRGRTFADLLTRTEARRADPDGRLGDVRRWTAVVLGVATALCVAGAVVGYTVVYTWDRGTERTRDQISVAGPKMVAQMLTYDPKSLHDDFARALSMATDKYRHTLLEQQDVVQKGKPVINEYWVTDSSIQTASPDRATMLLFMQGRRGDGAEQRYISATVRVTFVKLGDNWRVDDLTVVTKPKPPPGSGK